MWEELKQREIGIIPPAKTAARIKRARALRMQLAAHKEIISAHKSGVNSIQIDPVEARYLLAGASDASVAAYDTLQETSVHEVTHIGRHEAAFVLTKSSPQAHQFAVSSVQWYPVDTGIFVTGSFDQNVNVWDANTLQLELQFKMRGKVYAVAMSSVATTHMLIASGTEDVHVRLCDVVSGAFTHTLNGHRDGIRAVQWSASSEWVLITGGCEGAIRFWDIRRAGCFLSLDQHRSQFSCPLPSRSGENQNGNASSNRSNLVGSARGRAVSNSALRKHGLKVARQHPGMVSALDRSTAHYGAVTSLQTTPDGLYLYSAGTDSRVRLWDLDRGFNTLVNYGSTSMNAHKGTQISVSTDASLVFIPSSNAIKVYEAWSGHLHSTFHGHYDAVNCCVFHPQHQELYSGSNDRQILVWAPPHTLDVELENKQTDTYHKDEDAWSD